MVDDRPVHRVAAASGALILDPVLRRILDVQDETPELALWVTTGSEGSVPAMAWAEELMAVYQQAHLKSLGDPSPLSATPGTIYPAWPVMDAAQEALKLQREDLALLDGAGAEACGWDGSELETKDGRIGPILSMRVPEVQEDLDLFGKTVKRLEGISAT